MMEAYWSTITESTFFPARATIETQVNGPEKKGSRYTEV